MIYDVTINEKNYRLELSPAEGHWRCKLDGRDILVNALQLRPGVLSLVIDNQSYEIKREKTAAGSFIWVGDAGYAAELRDPRSLRSRKARVSNDKGPQKLIALMPGKIVRILVTDKTEVEAGQGVLVIEAMKMQNEIKSPKKGTLTKMMVAEGASVNAGDVLAIVD